MTLVEFLIHQYQTVTLLLSQLILYPHPHTHSHSRDEQEMYLLIVINWLMHPKSNLACPEGPAPLHWFRWINQFCFNKLNSLFILFLFILHILWDDVFCFVDLTVAWYYNVVNLSRTIWYINTVFDYFSGVKQLLYWGVKFSIHPAGLFSCF